MTEQTTQEATLEQAQAPSTQTVPARPKQPRQLVRFTFYKLDPQWQLLPADVRERGKQQVREIIDEYGQEKLIRTFGLYGIRADCDFMIWQATYDIEDLRSLNSQIRRSVMGPY